MSIGALLGGALGGAAGFFIGGPTGALYGAMLGFGVGMAIDPMTPDINGLGSPDPEDAVVSVEVGATIPDLVGTGKIKGHCFFYGGEKSEKIEVDVGGKGIPGGSQEQFAGYDYYMSVALGICSCPGDSYVNTLYAIYKNDDIDPIWPIFETQEEIDAWEGLDCPASGGQETIVIDNVGSIEFYFGTNDQVANTDMGALMDDDTINTPYRNLCWAYFNEAYIGKYNRLPTFKFVIKKIPTTGFPLYDEVQTYDANPMTAIWYALNTLGGLPDTWLDSDDFASAAAVLYNENRGISVLFDRQQSVLNYIEAFNYHIDGIIRYDSDGKFHPKLIREDYTVSSLPSINEDDMLEDPTVKPKSWIDTINEVKVQYSEIINVGRTAVIQGVLWATGDNDSGQIGDGTTTPRNVFGIITQHENDRITYANAASVSSAMLKNDGTLWTCGDNDDGNLGLGNTTDYDEFQQVTSPYSSGWDQIVHTSYNTYAIRSLILYTCGYNQTGQCAQNDAGVPGRDPKTTLVAESLGYQCIKVAAGDASVSSVAIMVDPVTQTNKLYITGYPFNGVCGKTGQFYEYTVEYSDDEGWTDIAYDGSTCFAKKGNNWYATGRNSAGEMGLGHNTSPISTWTSISKNFEILRTSASGHSVGLLGGTIWATGFNNEGQLGQGDKTNRNTWVQIGTAENWVDIWAGLTCTIALNSAGEIWCCGRGTMLAGSGNRTGTANTTTLAREDTDGTFIAVFASSKNNHTFALKGV